jgi:hypothetical protein
MLLNVPKSVVRELAGFLPLRHMLLLRETCTELTDLQAAWPHVWLRGDRLAAVHLGTRVQYRPALRSCEIKPCRFQKEYLAYVEQCPHLTQLKLAHENSLIKPEVLRDFDYARFRTLENLELFCRLDFLPEEFRDHLPCLTSLTLMGSALRFMPRLDGLEQISVRYPNDLNDVVSAFEAVEDVTALKFLRLEGASEADELQVFPLDLSQFSNLIRMSFASLNLGNVKLPTTPQRERILRIKNGRAEMKHVRDENLVELHLCNTETLRALTFDVSLLLETDSLDLSAFACLASLKLDSIPLTLVTLKLPRRFSGDLALVFYRQLDSRVLMCDSIPSLHRLVLDEYKKLVSCLDRDNNPTKYHARSWNMPRLFALEYGSKVSEVLDILLAGQAGSLKELSSTRFALQGELRGDYLIYQWASNFTQLMSSLRYFNVFVLESRESLKKLSKLYPNCKFAVDGCSIQPNNDPTEPR